ncbi:MAG TPA: hypothetical protein VM260_26280 [Pirellula sp.]|nr:hypothetical protein [Pirellula sp.]
MHRITLELRHATIAAYNSAETFNNPEAKMQSEEQRLSDLNSPTQSNLGGHWPPSFSRLLLAAVFSAGLGYIVLKTMYPVFVVLEEIAKVPEGGPSWIYERLDKAKVEVDGKNFSIVFGVIGAVFGASCVIFSFGAKFVKALVVAIVGSAAMGVLGANLSNWMFSNLRESNGKDLLIMGVKLDSMWQTTIGYSLLWGLIGFGVGLGTGSVRNVGKSLVAGISGLCGGVLGAMLYVVLTAQFSIGTTMNRVIPDSNRSQAIWLALFPIVIAVCIALGSGEKRGKGAA